MREIITRYVPGRIQLCSLPAFVYTLLVFMLRSSSPSMRLLAKQFCRRWLALALFVTSAQFGWAAGPRVQILAPQNGARISQDQNVILVSGKIASDRARSFDVDIFFLIDVSLS